MEVELLLLKWGWHLIPLLSSLDSEAPCGIFWCPGNTCENHCSRTIPRPISWGTNGFIVQSHMGHFICLVPELEDEPNSPTLEFFPLSTAPSSPWMHFYYKLKAFQSLVFCSSFFFPPEINFTRCCSHCPSYSVLSSLLYILTVCSLERCYPTTVLFLLYFCYAIWIYSFIFC